MVCHLVLIKRVKPSNFSAVFDDFLHCNCLPYFENLSILAHVNKKNLLEIKESLVILRDKPSVNSNLILHLCTYLILSLNKLISRYFFNPVSSCPSKYLYKTLKRKLFTNIKHGLIIGRDMLETRCQKSYEKTWISRKLFFFHKLIY